MYVDEVESRMAAARVVWLRDMADENRHCVTLLAIYVNHRMCVKIDVTDLMICFIAHIGLTIAL